MLSAVMYQRNGFFLIHIPVLNQILLNSIILKNINYYYSIHAWNEDDDAFDQQLKKWGVENILQMNQNPLQES